MDRPLIEHADELSRYAPPDHHGTVNVRLVEKDFCGSFELVRGIVQPGGEAEPHHHDPEHQVMYVISGQCEVTMGEDDPVLCGPGTIVRIPPRLVHRVQCVGGEPLDVVIVYSPPLPERNDTPVD